jgi:hypothetical protein
MSEYAQLKAKLAGHEKMRKDLVVRAETIHDGICRELNTGLVRVEDTDLERVLALFENFRDVHVSIAEMDGAIARIKRKLV